MPPPGSATGNEPLKPLRDWSLITGRGATKREGGGHVKFYPYEKDGEGAEKVLAMLKGGGTKCFGEGFTHYLEVFVLAILNILQKVSTL